MKTNKSYTKRIRVTRKGKLVSRKSGQDHFNSRENRRTRTAKRQSRMIVMKQSDRARFLPGTSR